MKEKIFMGVGLLAAIIIMLTAMSRAVHASPFVASDPVIQDTVK
jgi:hypothetical protein